MSAVQCSDKVLFHAVVRVTGPQVPAWATERTLFLGLLWSPVSWASFQRSINILNQTMNCQMDPAETVSSNRFHRLSLHVFIKVYFYNSC